MDDRLGALTTQLTLASTPTATSQGSSSPAAGAQPIGPRPNVGNGSVIDRSVKLGDADIHLESEPSGTFWSKQGKRPNGE